MSKLGVVHRGKEWDSEKGGYLPQEPIHDNYIEIYIIEAAISGDVEFAAFRSFETYNQDLLERASGCIDATDGYMESECPGKTPEEADNEGLETCTGVPMGDMIRALKVAKQALIDKNGEMAAELANDFLHIVLEADENIGFFKAYLYTN